MGIAVRIALVLLVAQATFRSRLDTVEVSVTVRGSAGQLATNLTKDDFELYDNGKPRDITVFAAGQQPTAVALLIDRSGSIGQQAPQVAAAAEAFIGKLLPDDRAAIASLFYECQPLTAEKAKLLATIRGKLPLDPGSPIWAGLDRTLTSLAAESGRKAVVLFSDGDDYGPQRASPFLGAMGRPCRPWPNPSEATLEDASKHAQREGVTVYTVSVSNAGGTTKDGDLRSIARDTGGDRYRLARDTELPGAFTKIIDELHQQYLLGFTPALFDGKVHQLDVRVKRPGMTAHARKSYVAASADTSAAAGVSIAPLTDDDVDQAIRLGASGQKLQAACTASPAFKGEPLESDAYVDVLLEGPMGRIAHAARDARGHRPAFGRASVTDDMRAPVVHVIADVKPTTRQADSPAADTTDPPSTRVTPPVDEPRHELAGVVSLRLRSKQMTERMLQPLRSTPREGAMPLLVTPGSSAAATPGSIRHMEALFDLAEFKTLPGADVEVLVHSRYATRYCTIPARNRAAIR